MNRPALETYIVTQLAPPLPVAGDPGTRRMIEPAIYNGNMRLYGVFCTAISRGAIGDYICMAWYRGAARASLWESCHGF